jgi:hypothetical protein
MRKRPIWLYALLAALALLVALIAFVLAVAGTAQLPGPKTISSSELGYIATGQAREEIDPHVVRVTCPSGTFHLGNTVTCQALLRFVHGVTRTEKLSVTIHHDDSGGLSVDVRAR